VLCGVTILALGFHYPAMVSAWSEWQEKRAPTVQESVPTGRESVPTDPDREWARQLFATITQGQTTDEARFVALNYAIHDHIVHPPVHPGPMTPREIWEKQLGWCHDVTHLFVYLAKAGGYDARPLQLIHTDGVNGHFVPEVFYDGKWHVFGPDHGKVYRLPDGTVASYEDLLKDNTPVRIVPDPWKGENGEGMEGFYVQRLH